MKDIKSILSTKYENSNEILELLSKFELENIISNAIEKIEMKIKIKDFEELPKISGIILNEINSKIKNVKDDTEKRKLEYFLSDLFQDYIEQINKLPDSQKILYDLISNIRTACEYNGYNYTELNNLLSLEKQTSVIKKHTNEFYYEWLGEDYELDEITRELLDKKYIYSIREFKKLFKPHTGNLYIKFNKIYKDELIVFLQILKEEKLIKPRGKGNSGHFTPFVKYAIDNENKFIIEKNINKEHERIKKNKEKYPLIKEKMLLLVKGNLNPKRQ
jgi:hypothetical protein